MSGKKARRAAASATPWDDVPDRELEPSQRIVAASHRSAYAFRHEAFAGDIDFLNSYHRDACPRCGGPASRYGKEASGLQRYRCASCGRTFTPATGTIFEGRKLPIPAWTDFLVQTFSYASVSLMTREDRRSDTTLPYWMAKLFAVLEGVQDDTVLSGRVWIDETYVPDVAGKLWRRPDGKLPRGISRNQLCIGVGVDESGKSVFIHEGKGHVSMARTWDTFGSRIAPGSTLVHDLDHSHGKLVEELKLKSEAYNGKALLGVPDDANPLFPVNRMCFLLKAFLRSHSGFDRDDLQGYLNLFHVIVNEPDDKLEKAAFVLDRAMRCPASLRFREFYNVKPRSDAGDSSE